MLTASATTIRRPSDSTFPANYDGDAIDPKVEDAIRLRAFHIFYDRTFRDERDCLKRFVKALLASAGPIEDPQLVLEWDRDHRRRRKSK